MLTFLTNIPNYITGYKRKSGEEMLDHHCCGKDNFQNPMSNSLNNEISPLILQSKRKREAFSEQVRKNIPETVPETVPEAVPEPVSETVPETVPEIVPETVPLLQTYFFPTGTRSLPNPRPLCLTRIKFAK